LDAAERGVGVHRPWIRRELLTVLENEPPTWGEVIRSAGTWSLRLTRQLRGFEAVVTLEDYVSRIEALAPRQPTLVRAIPSPLALPNALDYFDVVWRLTVGQGKGILWLPNAEQTAMLALDVSTSEELVSRLAALREVLHRLEIPGTEGQPLERLRSLLKSALSPEDAEASGVAIDALVAAIALRNGLVHGHRGRVPDACLVLGLDWPITDFAQAWKIIQGRCVESLETMRDLLRARRLPQDQRDIPRADAIRDT
jgi:hypothetical protein